MKYKAATAALLTALATSAQADFGITWSGDLEFLPGNPVTQTWQFGTVPNNGMGISNWCASRFGNGYDCIEEFIEPNRMQLETVTCGGAVGAYWLCAGQRYLFPQGTSAVVLATRFSPDTADLEACLQAGFDELGNEIATQFEAIQTSQATLSEGKNTIIANQAASLTLQSQLQTGQQTIASNQVASRTELVSQGNRLINIETKVGEVNDGLTAIRLQLDPLATLPQ